LKLVSRKKQLKLARISLRRWRSALRRRAKEHAHDAGTRLASRKIVTISPPAEFSFSKNYDATVRCLRDLKSAVFAKNGEGKRAEIFLDLSKVKNISLAGALVLGAEIHRWRKQRGPGLRARNINEWTPRVRRILTSIGFFKLLRVKIPNRIKSEADSSEVTILPMISSTELSPELLQKILEDLRSVAEILHQDPFVYGALVEAAYNAKLHAYPEDHDYEFPPIIQGWWATASWNPEEGIVKFLVYDQGVGIPATLPRWQGWEQIRAWLSSTLGSIAVNLKDSSNLIQAAIRIDRTSLQGGHGKGLQDVIAPVEGTPGSSVRILSGNGSVLYDHSGNIEKKDEALHIGGTLIEWRLPVGTHERQ